MTVPVLVPAEQRADLVEVRKARRLLILSRGGCVLRSYRAALGFAPVGHKRQEGDGRTPEGRYAFSAAWRLARRAGDGEPT